MRKALCCVCGERSRDKMAAFYWWWRWPTGDRRSYKQFYDRECAGQLQALFRQASEEQSICAECKESVDLSTSVDVEGRGFIPGRDVVFVVLPYHASCFERAADRFMQGALRLHDREVEAGGPPPQQAGNPWDSWGAIGIDPA